MSPKRITILKGHVLRLQGRVILLSLLFLGAILIISNIHLLLILNLNEWLLCLALSFGIAAS